MAFSTWSDLARRMRDDLAAGNWRMKSYDMDGMRREFVSPQEFLQMLDYAERRAAEEQTPFAARSIQRSAGR